MLVHPLTRGRVVEAEYHTPVNEAFRGNPYIEALPPTWSREVARARMAFYPGYDPAHRLLPEGDREDLAAGLSRVRHPVGIHLELQSRVARLIRWGYEGRNPALPSFQKILQDREAGLIGSARQDVTQGPIGALPGSWATGLTVLGITGIGKTVAIEMCLGLFPQLILHTSYQNRPFQQTQVVWLRLQCPPDGSILTLCVNFFEAMDRLHGALGIQTNYVRDYVPARPVIQRLIPSMSRLAWQHGLGVLVLDELQDLNPRGSRAILSFLVQLVNTIGVPVILIGGIDALPVLSQQFRQARRGATEGDMILGRSEPGRQWKAFCEALWQYQYTRKETPLTDEHVSELYQHSQGITQYLVLLYKLAQIRAIATGCEEVTPALIRTVAADSLNQARPVLQSLAKGNSAVLERFGDVLPSDGFHAMPFLRPDVPSPVVVRDAPSSPATPVQEEGQTGEVPATPAAPTPDGPSLRDIGLAAAQRGVDPIAALTEAGFMGDEVWGRMILPENAGLQ